MNALEKEVQEMIAKATAKQAAELAALRAENAKLRVEYSNSQNEAAYFRNENAKLREALEKVAKVTALRGSDAEFGIDHLRELARRALEAKQEAGIWVCSCGRKNAIVFQFCECGEAK